MKVAGKIRCSTSKQDLESQRYALIEWAKKNNHILTLTDMQAKLATLFGFSQPWRDFLCNFPPKPLTKP